jgi:hypothetical protein
VAKRRLLIWFFGTTGSSGNGRFTIRPILNLHQPSRTPRFVLRGLPKFGVPGNGVSKVYTAFGRIPPLLDPTDGGWAPTKERSQ